MEEPGKQDNAAGTNPMAAAMNGTENEELEWGRRHIAPDYYMAERKTEILGTGFKVRHRAKRKPAAKEEEKTGDAFGKRPGVTFFILAEQQEQMKNYLKKKIDRLDLRVTALEERELRARKEPVTAASGKEEGIA